MLLEAQCTPVWGTPLLALSSVSCFASVNVEVNVPYGAI